MERKIILCAVLAVLGAQLITPVSASPSIWLYYDDGDCDRWGIWTNYLATPMKAVLFADIETSRLLTVQYWIEEDPNYSFNLHIMDSDWVDIYTNTYTPSQTGWNTLDLSGETIVVGGQFIVGMEFTHAIPDDGGYTYPPHLGGDHDDPDVGHSWFWSDYPDDEPSIEEYEDYMIRAEIRPVGVGVGGIWAPVDKLSLLAPYISLASTIIVAIAATAIHVKRVKRREEK